MTMLEDRDQLLLKTLRHSATQAAEIERLRAALNLGRECVVESFEHAKTHDDTMLAEARLRDIDDALALERAGDAK